MLLLATLATLSSAETASSWAELKEHCAAGRSVLLSNPFDLILYTREINLYGNKVCKIWGSKHSVLDMRGAGRFAKVGGTASLEIYDIRIQNGDSRLSTVREQIANALP